MGRDRKIFKENHQGQTILFPQSLDEIIPEQDVVRVVNSIVNELDISSLLKKYKGGGASSYHPRMMLKVLLYSYLKGTYSCRKIAQALRENIYYMWLSGNSMPVYKTINNFRSGSLRKEIKSIFESLVRFCVNEGYINLDELYVDGTKIEADANKHTHVWKKNVKRYKDGVHQRVQAVLDEVDNINEEEDKMYGDKDLPEKGEHIDSDELKRKISDLTEKINKDSDKKKARELSKQRTKLKNEEKKLKKYEKQEEILNGRNSYSKTDPDATFMRSKDDQLLPGYNVQASSQNQFVVHYTIGQSSSDQYEFEPHLQTLPDEFKPKAYVGDAAYGTHLNYLLAEQEEIEPYLKYSTFYRESKTSKKSPFHRDNFKYDPDTDTFTCPQNRSLVYSHTEEYELRNGFKTHRRVYQSLNCKGCPHFENCVKGKTNRSIKINPEWEEYKAKARSLLNSPQGVKYRKHRGIDIEAVFGHIKKNRGYRRFMLRGLDKVNIEFGLLAMVQNIAKIAAISLNLALNNLWKLMDPYNLKMSV
jgi:transposase